MQNVRIDYNQVRVPKNLGYDFPYRSLEFAHGYEEDPNYIEN